MKHLRGDFLRLQICALASLALLSAGRTQAQTAKGGDGVVSGTVQKMTDSQPIKGANVQLLSLDDHRRIAAVATDNGGRFELPGIDAGRYRLRVSHDGFLTQEYGARKPSEAGATLTLRPGQAMRDLVFRMVRSAVIAGRVISEDGEPLPWVKVTALREVYLDGRRRLAAETMSPTNDLGEYRLFGLKPGRYLISADYRPGQRSCEDSAVANDDDGGLTAVNYTGNFTGAGGSGSRGSAEAGSATSPAPTYVPTFYPSSVDAAKAMAVAVKAGEEISSIEILVGPTTTYTVRGRVLNMGSRRTGASVTMTLAARSTAQSFGLPGRNFTVDGPEGPFAMGNVLPGPYVLLAQWFDGGTHYQAVQNIDVGNADLNGVNVFIGPGTAVRGHVTWDGAPSMTRDSMLVFLRETEIEGANGSMTRTLPDGSFTVPGVFDGTYRVVLNGQSQDAYLEAVRYGVTDGLVDGFAVRRGADATLEVTVSSKGARVQGAVLDADNLPAVGVWVVLVPDDPHRNEMQLYKTMTTDQNGRYLLRGIAPGDYKLFSWEDVEVRAWEDPEFLRGFEEKGEKLSVAAGDQKIVDLTAIRK
jgi:Carboxypeptidase regulatory-like domain